MRWRNIDYFGARICVSENGDVFWNGTMRKIYYNHDGYSNCSINVPNKGWRSVGVARLVALAFIPNPNNLPEVNHKDYNRKNSNVNNLEWISRKDNILYSLQNRADYFGEKNPNFGNRKLSKKYKENKEYAKEKQGRPGLKNGRCVKINLYYDGEFMKQFNYINECCEYLKEKYNLPATINSLRSRIFDSIKHNNRPYKKHLTFEYVQ